MCCSVCGARRLSRRGDRRLVGVRFGRWREETFGRARWLTLRYSLPLSVWVDPLAEQRRISYLQRREKSAKQARGGAKQKHPRLVPLLGFNSFRAEMILTNELTDYEVRITVSFYCASYLYL